MTTPPGGDWGDDRLDAAFTARAAAAPATPSDLADEVLASTVRSDRRARPWPGLAVSGAVATLVVVLAGSLLLKENGPAPGASNSPASTHAAPTDEPQLAILEAFGDPLTVTEALEVRDGQHGDREIAVRGFLLLGPTLACGVLGHQNPIIRRCTASAGVMEHPAEQVEVATDQGVVQVTRPGEPSFHASFTLVGEPQLPTPAGGDASTSWPVVLIGHFHDRRAAQCEAEQREAEQREACGRSFVVDRVVEVNGDPLPVSTHRLTSAATKDSAGVVDALAIGAAPESIVVSRQLLEVGDLEGVEPVLANDATISAWGDRSAPFWLVTTVDLADDVPIARTFALIDGSDWFAEVTAEGAVYLERSAPEPSAQAQPNLPSADPSTFDGAPTSILGIPVRGISSIQRDRAAAMDELGRTEFAIRAWYQAPNPAVVCDELPPQIHEPRPPCDEARHWLLDDPSQLGHEPGQLRLNPALDHYTPVINPLLPIDVAFDVGETWSGGMPSPRPVIVLGHFNDHRVDTYAGNLYFVIDALAWTPDRPVGSLDTVVRLTATATEDVDAVLGRIAAINERDAVATWVTVADAADFVRIDGRSGSMPEFTTGAPVWMVARLVHDKRDGRQRLAVMWGWTADGGSRVWWEECPDCGPELGTTLDIVDLDANTPLVRVFDYDQAISSVGPATGLSGLSWQQPHGNATDWIDVAHGRTAREVVLRWFSPSCDDVTWNVKVHEYTESEIYLSPYTRNEQCEGDDRVVRRILIEFEDPIDIETISGPSCCG